MSRNYYCLVAGMPEIAFDQRKSIFKPEEFKAYLKETLTPSDFNIVEYFYLEYDNHNIINMMVKNQDEEEFNDLGVYTYEEMQDAIKDPQGLASYLIEFINDYQEADDKDNPVRWEKDLLVRYYNYVRKCPNEFVRKWFEFEFMLKTIITAATARKFELSTEENLIITDEDIMTIAKSNSKDFGISIDYPFVHDIVGILEEENLYKREEAIDMYKWKWLDEHTVFEYFSLEKVISILLKLRIVERWIVADKEKGKALFVKILDDIKSGYTIE